MMSGFSYRPAVLLTLAAWCVSTVSADTYYVKPSGNDGNSGNDTVHALGTIRKAADLAGPGDTIFVMNGTYANAGAGSIVNLSKSGTLGAWIVFIAYPGHHPILSFNGWGAIAGKSVSYIEINGLEIYGNRDNITLEYAKSHGGSGESSGDGISFDGRNETQKPHHIRILNCTVAKCCGGGISFIQCDYVTIDNNRVYGNAWYSQWANSGISTYQNWRCDESIEYKMFVTRNVCYDNRSLVNWVATSALSDGNGIIIDDSKNSQNNSTLGAYTGRTLVANNISFNNGGSGIHAFSSEHVDIVNNTTYCNGQVVGYANCFAGSSADCRILNNIIYASAGKKTNDNWENVNVTYDYNIYFGGLAAVNAGTHEIVADPQFVNQSIDPSVADFRVYASSRGIDSGTTFPAVPADIEGTRRPQGSGYDIGAFELEVSTGMPGFAVSQLVSTAKSAVVRRYFTGAEMVVIGKNMYDCAGRQMASEIQANLSH
jgi:hypothetical protein